MDHYEFWERTHRLAASAHRLAAAREELWAEMARAAKSFHELAAALQGAADREVAEHPDLAELNVQLDGFYGESRSDQ